MVFVLGCEMRLLEFGAAVVYIAGRLGEFPGALTKGEDGVGFGQEQHCGDPGSA